MRYAYYSKLRASDKAIYRRSDAIEAFKLNGSQKLRPVVRRLEEALAAEDRSAVELTARELIKELLGQLAVRPVTVKVLATRPSDDWNI